MHWLLDHIQISILILLGLGSLVKGLLDSIAKTRRETSRTGTPPPAKRDLARDKSYRKRAPSVPPPLARPATTPPPIPQVSFPPASRQPGYEMEAAAGRAKALKHQQDLAARLELLREDRAATTTTGGAAATRARFAAKGAATSISSTTANTLRTRLRNPSEIRRALVLKEILDLPVGLR